MKSLNTNTVILAALLVAGLCLAAAGCGGNKNKTGGLDVTAVNPEDGAHAVYLDQTIRITFSKPVDRETLNEDTILVSADGEPAAGRILAQGETVMFVPAQLKPNATYTLTVSADVADPSGKKLGEPYTSSFTTTDTNRDGSAPFDPIHAAPFRDKNFVHLSRQVEYVLLGAYYKSISKNLFVIDPLEFNQMEPAPTDEVMYSVTEETLGSDYKKQAVAGNLDRDPLDEVVMLLTPAEGPAMLRVLDKEGDGFTVRTLDAQLAIDGETEGAYKYDLALGDVDRDGYDEIVVAGVGPSGKGHLWVLDDARTNHKLLSEKAIPGKFDGNDWTGVYALKVAVGNVDEDEEKEIVLAAMFNRYSSANMLLVIDDMATPYEEIDQHELLMNLFGPNTWYTSALASGQPDYELRLADLDGDKVDEIVVADRWAITDDTVTAVFWELAAYNRKDGELAEKARSLYNPYPDIFSFNRFPFPPHITLETLDLDGDKRAEILLEGKLWRFNAEDSAFNQMDHSVNLYDSGDNAVEAVAVGDVNGDGNEDIMLARTDGSLQAWGMNKVHVGYDLDMNPTYETNWEKIDERDGGGPSDQHGHVLVAANLDRDSVILAPNTVNEDEPEERTVEHKIVFSDDVIIAVLAAAPCYDEPWQSTGDCSTGIGLSTGGTITAGASFAVKAGVTVGVDQDIITAFGAGKTAFEFSAKLKVEVETKVYSSLSVSIEQTISDYAGHGEDLVIFYTVPHHQYTYHIASHPNTSAEGSAVVINIPMQPRIFSVSREFYNANNGSQTDIDENVLAHTPGEPLTYPGLSDVDNILSEHLPLGITLPPVTVNQGSGHKEIELSLGAEATLGAEITLSTEFETETCVVGFCIGFNVGASVSAFAEATFSTSTVFSGSVGAIDAGHWADNMYDFGLFAYLDTMRTPNGRVTLPFTVVNYYVN